MPLPIWVGIILVVVFLITLSGWFYGYIAGLREVVLDDQYFSYRIGFASLLTIILFVGAFWGIATINECQNGSSGGIFSGINCTEYNQVKLASEQIFQSQKSSVN